MSRVVTLTSDKADTILRKRQEATFEFDAERSRRRTLIDYCGWCAKSREDSPISELVAVDRAPELAKTNAVSYAWVVSRFE